MESGVEPRAQSGLPSWVAHLTIALGFFLALLQPVVGPVAGELILIGVVIASLLLVPVGLWANRSRTLSPWVQSWIAGILFALASALRVALIEAPPAVRVLPEIIVIVGFAMAIFGFLRVLSFRSQRARGTVADTLLFATVVVLIGWVLVMEPTLRTGDLTAIELIEISFPAIDALALFLAIRVALTEERRLPCVAFIVLSTSFVLFGDTIWALGVAGLHSLPESAYFAAYLPGFAFLAAAPLHPSVRSFRLASSAPVRPLGPARIAGMVTALATPAILAVAGPSSIANAFVVVGASILTIALVTWRVVTAVNEHALAEQRMRHRALHDDLTGLPNRAWVLQHIEEGLADGDRVVMILLDLDRFQYVNDTWGHEAGDELLRGVAGRLEQLTVASSLARTGGDEFAIVMSGPNSDPDVAARLIRASLEAPFQLSATECFVSPSIGIAVAPDDGTRLAPLDLFREADTALSRAKHQGRNQSVHFDASMRATATHRLETERALRHAMERDELEVHYQPIVSLSDGRWIGVEALLRWRHPDRGLVSPAEFIPIAEDSGLIVDLGSFVLDQAAHAMARWRDLEAFDWNVAVNLSPRQLTDSDITAIIRAALERNCLEPRHLSVELTESMLLADDSLARNTLSRIREMGVRVAVDDFGTGYSSLSYLKHLPIDTVKIDRSFVSGLPNDPESAAIINAILGMTRALGLQTIAEGVERDEQHRRLLDLGCHVGQGFRFARPMPAFQLTAALEDRAVDFVPASDPGDGAGTSAPAPTRAAGPTN